MKAVLTDYGLTVTETEPSLVAGSVSVYRLQLETDASTGAGWAGFSRTLVFENSSDKSRVEVIPDTSGAARIPWEVLKSPGQLSVGCYGSDSTGARRVTQMAVCGTVSAGCFGDAASSQEPTQDTVEQIEGLIGEMSSKIASLESTLAAAQKTLSAKQDATGVYLMMGTDSSGNAAPQVVVG